MELPDLKGREAILKVHAKKIKHGRRLWTSAPSPGRPPAPPARSWPTSSTRPPCGRCATGRRLVTQADLEESVETVIAGYQKKNAILTDKEKWIVSYHEIGHALVAARQTHSAPVQKITIIPRTSGALGYTMQVEEGNHYLMSREEI